MLETDQPIFTFRPLYPLRNITNDSNRPRDLPVVQHAPLFFSSFPHMNQTANRPKYTLGGSGVTKTRDHFLSV